MRVAVPASASRSSSTTSRRSAGSARRRARSRAHRWSTVPSCPACLIALVEMRFPAGTHETYQLVGRRRARRPRRAGGRARARPPDARGHDASDDRRGDDRVPAVRGSAGLGAELAAARLIGGEQSNTLGRLRRRADPQGLPAARGRDQPGARAAALPDRARLRERRRRSAAGTRYRGRPLDATLGILQQFVAGGLDGWELALDELASAPDAFLARVRRLGEVTGEMHTVLASDGQRPELRAGGAERRGARPADRVDRRGDRAGLPRPARRPRGARADPPPRRGRARAAAPAHLRRRRRPGDPPPRRLPPRPDPVCGRRLDRARLRGRARPLAPRAAPQALAAPRRRRDAALVRLRRVGGGPLRGVEVPDGWEEQARAEFLDGYLETVDPAIVPPGRDALDRLLSVFELEKAVYELRYELTTGPTGCRSRSPGSCACSKRSPCFVSVGSTRRPRAQVPALPVPERGRVTEPYLLPIRTPYLGAHPPTAVSSSARSGPTPRRCASCRWASSSSRRTGPASSRASSRTPSSRSPTSSRCATRRATTYTLRDPYAFLPTLGELDLHLAGEGRHEELYGRLGAHVRELDGVAGVSFAVWAPSARSVSVVGDFNGWDGRLHPMRSLGASRDLGALRAGRRAGRTLQVRDPRPGRQAAPEGRPVRVPYGAAAEERVDRAPTRGTSGGTRSGWSAAAAADAAHDPDVDLRGAPRLVAANTTRATGRSRTVELADELVGLRDRLGFTHVELLPVMEHPFDGVVGLPGDGLLRADIALRHAGRLPRVRRPPARGRHRRDPRLGARALPEGRLRARALRRHARSTSTRTRAAASTPTGARSSSTTAATRCGTSSSRARSTGSRSSTPTACASTRSRRCSTSTTRARRASGCRTSTAATRTSTRSRSCKQLNEVAHATQPGRADDGGGVDRVAGRLAADLTSAASASTSSGTWAGCTTRSITSSATRSTARFHHHAAHVRPDLRVLRELRPAALARRGRAREGLAAREDARRRWQQLANLRALYAYMWAHPGKKLLFMGGEIAPGARVERRGLARLAPARDGPGTPACSRSSAT